MGELSKDAKAVIGAWFGLMSRRSELTFHMVKSRPSPRAQAALDELVAARLLSRTPWERSAAVTYRPLVNTREFGLWLAKHVDDPDVNFPLVEPIAPPAAHIEVIEVEE